MTGDVVGRAERVVARPVARDRSGITDDDELVALWLSNRAETTRRNYDRAVSAFRAFRRGELRLRELTHADMQRFAEALAQTLLPSGRPLAPSSQATTLSAIKSLITYGADIGYLGANVGRRLTMPRVVEQTRMLSRRQVRRMIDAEPDARNHAILRTLYITALRVSELQALCWRDLTARGKRGQIAVHGKGGRQRFVLIPRALWVELRSMRPAMADPSWPIFASPVRSNGTRYPLSVRQIERVVITAARRAGITEGVYPHLLRAAHATHAAERLVPVHIIQATLGHAQLSTTGRYMRARPTDSSALYLEDDHD